MVRRWIFSRISGRKGWDFQNANVWKGTAAGSPITAHVRICMVAFGIINFIVPMKRYVRVDATMSPLSWCFKMMEPFAKTSAIITLLDYTFLFRFYSSGSCLLVRAKSFPSVIDTDIKVTGQFQNRLSWIIMNYVQTIFITIRWSS